MSEVQFKNISYNYDKDTKKIVDFNVSIEDKDFFVIAGPKGSGKSLLLKIAAGIEKSFQGEILMDGQNVNKIPAKDRDIAMIFRDYALYPNMSVYENMEFSLKIKKKTKEEIDKKIREAAKLLDIISILDEKASKLNNLNKLKVCLAAAMVREPKLVLLEEPLWNLDSEDQEIMRTQLKALHKKFGCTFIYSTNNYKEALALASKIVVINEGIIEQVGSSREIYEMPQNLFVACFFGSPKMNFVQAKLAEKKDRVLLAFGDDIIILPEDKSKILREKQCVGKEVIFGIRPEYISEDCDFIQQHSNGEIKVNIEFVEEIALEQCVHLSKGKVNFIVKLNRKINGNVGESIKIALDESKIVVFHKDSGNILA